MNLSNSPLEFFTATNFDWLPLLSNNAHKKILIEALKHRVENKQVSINAFVIMPNHFHIIWSINDNIDRYAFQRDLMKFTARSLLKFMLMNEDPLLKKLLVNNKDRQHHVWKRNSLSVDLFTEDVFKQKLEYIHNNPLQPKWKLSCSPEEYLYSSAEFYEHGIDRFNILTDYRD